MASQGAYGFWRPGVPVSTSTHLAAERLRPHARWKKRKEECIKAGNCEMGGFTRLLHSGQADDLMDELPTVVVDPLPQSMVEHSWYVVLNRPYAFVQWTQKVTIPEKYVLMSEPDHIFLRPMPNFMNGNDPGEQQRVSRVSGILRSHLKILGYGMLLLLWPGNDADVPVWCLYAKLARALARQCTAARMAGMGSGL